MLACTGASSVLAVYSLAVTCGAAGARGVSWRVAGACGGRRAPRRATGPPSPAIPSRPPEAPRAPAQTSPPLGSPHLQCSAVLRGSSERPWSPRGQVKAGGAVVVAGGGAARHVEQAKWKVYPTRHQVQHVLFVNENERSSHVYYPNYVLYPGTRVRLVSDMTGYRGPVFRLSWCLTFWVQYI